MGCRICYEKNQGLIEDKIKENLINVFVPTTPNPTSGFLLMILKRFNLFRYNF